MIYTVIGLVDDNCDLLVAGVIEGDHCIVDTQYESGGLSRYAACVEANSPDEAEEVAQRAYAEETTIDVSRVGR